MRHPPRACGGGLPGPLTATLSGAGREGLKQAFRVFWEATPGTHEIEDQIAEGDKVVTRLTARGVHERDLPGIPRPHRPPRTMLSEAKSRAVHSGG
ncbi:ester cyclase [Streptomyces solaniscabiei]|uniref:ester cyclase n=1 Tax=Streptomyces solaniscabiei TaxID=2683255 RepID=UPI001CE31FCE